MIATTASGAIISDVMFDEVAVSYSGVTTTMVYKLKGVVKATVTETVDTNTPPRMIGLKRVDS
jgi:hypothetical protein